MRKNLRLIIAHTKQEVKRADEEFFNGLGIIVPFAEEKKLVKDEVCLDLTLFFYLF